MGDGPESLNICAHWPACECQNVLHTCMLVAGLVGAQVCVQAGSPKYLLVQVGEWCV